MGLKLERFGADLSGWGSNETFFPLATVRRVKKVAGKRGYAASWPPCPPGATAAPNAGALRFGNVFGIADRKKAVTQLVANRQPVRALNGLLTHDWVTAKGVRNRQRP